MRRAPGRILICQPPLPISLIRRKIRTAARASAYFDSSSDSDAIIRSQIMVIRSMVITICRCRSD